MENKKQNLLFVHRFQPIKLDDFGLDDDIIKLFKTLIIMDDLNILLIGNIASGKTSLLNAIVREYFDGLSPKQYEENVLYINNLKEQGINYCRTDVKTFCQTCSSIKNKKKIIVLDDIDFINDQSQHVFRTCIDKYQHNVHFIASCTNVQKVLENIQSRLNIIKLKPIEREKMHILVNKIKNTENISIDSDAEDFIINVSNNGVKIITNYMEKFKLLGEHINHELAIQLCTNISFFSFEEYTQFIKNHDLKNAIKIIYELYDKGYSVMDILDNYFLFVKNTDLLSEEEKYIIIPYICKYISIFHNIHEDEIELALFTNNLINAL
jgi:DNA polymerase III delta prime subunit